MQDGTDDTSSATPVDSASDTTAAPAQALPSSSTPTDEDSSAVDGPTANGVHLPNGTAAVDNDGFRRQHDPRAHGPHRGQVGPRRPEYQQPDDNFRFGPPVTMLCWYHKCSACQQLCQQSAAATGLGVCSQEVTSLHRASLTSNMFLIRVSCALCMYSFGLLWG